MTLRSTRRLLLLPLWPIAWALEWVSRLLSRAALYSVHRTPPNADRLRVMGASEPVREKLAAASRLIARYEPERLNQFDRDRISIKVREIPEAAEAYYEAGVRQIVLDEARVLNEPPEAIALLLVHEGEHAKRRIAGEEYTWDNAVEVERACMDAEIAFARRLPNGGRLVSRAMRQRNALRIDHVAAVQ